MNTDPLNESIQEYYQAHKLGDERLKALLTMDAGIDLNHTEQGKAQLGYWVKRWRFQRNFSIAASLLFLLAGSFMLQSLINPVTAPLPMRVAHEIALNHNKQLAAEFSVKTFEQLDAVMTKLDFSPAVSARLAELGYRIQGARYCSIQGQLAAQIHLIDQAGNKLTLYQTELNDELEKLPDAVHLVDGVTINIWRENTLLFGLAQSN